MKKNLSSKYKYDHMGVPLNQITDDMVHIEKLKMWVTKYEDSSFRVQYHFYDKGCTIHQLIQSRPHVALRVPNLVEAIVGQNVILAPYEPLPGYKVAFIESEGTPIELIESDLTDEEIIALENASIDHS